MEHASAVMLGGQHLPLVLYLRIFVSGTEYQYSQEDLQKVYTDENFRQEVFRELASADRAEEKFDGPHLLFTLTAEKEEPVRFTLSGSFDSIEDTEQIWHELKYCAKITYPLVFDPGDWKYNAMFMTNAAVVSVNLLVFFQDNSREEDLQHTLLAPDLSREEEHVYSVKEPVSFYRTPMYMHICYDDEGRLRELKLKEIDFGGVFEDPETYAWDHFVRWYSALRRMSGKEIEVHHDGNQYYTEWYNGRLQIRGNMDTREVEFVFRFGTEAKKILWA